jgi:hypothetical protein
MYCPKCRKEIVVMGIPPGAASIDDIESIAREIEAEGKLVLFNPPPFGPHLCPMCSQTLDPSPPAEA